VEATGQPLLPPYHVEEVGGVPVAFIGATHPDVRSIVVRGAVDGLAFPPPAGEINRYVRELKARGIRTMVVLIHEGGAMDRASGRLVGPITRTVEELDPEVDVVVSAHTHQGYATRHAGRLVTQGFAYSTAFVDIDLTIDVATREVIDAQAEVVTTYNDRLPPDPAVQAIVDRAEAAIGPRVNRVVGTSAERLTNDFTRTGESALGNLIADAFRWKTGADVGMTNPGGIRTSLEAGEVTWGELYAIQPFGNDLVTMSLTGEQLSTLFNDQWGVEQDGSERYRPLQFSGLRVTWDGRRPMGERIVQLALGDGRPIDRGASYRVTVNSFMAGGSDPYAVLAEGTERETGVVDVEAFVEYVEQLGRPIDSTVEGRITRVD
jgi:5'-nucleotidase